MTICSLQKTFIYNDIDRWKVKERIQIFYENTNQKRTRVAILILEKLDLRAKKITRNKEKHYIFIVTLPRKHQNPKHVPNT